MTNASNVKKSQLNKFKDLAREVEADESEERFDRVLKKVAKAPRPSKSPVENESSDKPK